MSISAQLTETIQPVSQKNMPEYGVLMRRFDDAKKEPKAKPLGVKEYLHLVAKRVYERISDKLFGIDTPREYNTGQIMIPSRGGEKYKTSHIRNGREISQTVSLSRVRHLDKSLLSNEIKSTYYPNEEKPEKSVTTSTHTLMSIGSVKRQLVTEGINLPDGKMMSRTQNFETGETTFRESDKSTFREWTFDKQHKLIFEYEGRFNIPNTPDMMTETTYGYDNNGKLNQATQKRAVITPEQEIVKTTSLPVTADKPKLFSQTCVAER